MIKQIDDVLSAWVHKQPDGHTPLFDLPPQSEGELKVHCYLFEVADDPQRHNVGLPNIQPTLRYLLTTSCSSACDAHRLLGELLNAALEKPYFELEPGVIKEFEVEFELASSPVWAALRIAPRPAFVIRVPLIREWPQLRGYRVETVAVDVQELVTLYGRAIVPPLEPAQPPLPIAQAMVDFVDLNRYAYTDSRGLFSVPGVPAAGEPLHITITAHGCSQSFDMHKTGTEEAPEQFVLHIPDLPAP